MSYIERLTAKKSEYRALRARLRAEYAARLEADMAPYEYALSHLAAEAVANGNTRTEVARALGESRTTLNARLRLVENEVEVPARVDRKVEAEPAKDYTNIYSIDGDYLDVDYAEYGPDGITAAGRFTIVREEETGEYWFFDGGIHGNVPELTKVLDTRFDGWYYEDARAFVTKHMQEVVTDD